MLNVRWKGNGPNEENDVTLSIFIRYLVLKGDSNSWLWFYSRLSQFFFLLLIAMIIINLSFSDYSFLMVTIFRLPHQIDRHMKQWTVNMIWYDTSWQLNMEQVNETFFFPFLIVPLNSKKFTEPKSIRQKKKIKYIKKSHWTLKPNSNTI